MTKGPEVWSCEVGRPPKAGIKYQFTAWLLTDPPNRGYVEVVNPATRTVVHSFEHAATAPDFEDFREPIEHINAIVDMLNCGQPAWPAS